MAVEIEEAVRSEETPSDYVARLADDKARAARARLTDDCVVIAADTVVVIDDVILGKPADRGAFIEMLGLLSGRTHAVLTGVSVSVGGRVRTAVSRTSVRFRNIALHEMEAYWESGEPKDKAGGYGIQGVGGIFVERLEGSYSGVVGLPLAETEQMLTGLGVDLWKCREGGAGCEDGAGGVDGAGGEDGPGGKAGAEWR